MKLLSISLVTSLVIMFSPIAVSADLGDEYIIRKAGTCFAGYDTVADLIEEISEKDKAILSIYSHIEVAEDNVERWNVIRQVEPNNPDILVEIDGILKERNKLLKEVVSLMHNRNIKAERMKNLRVELAGCNKLDIPDRVYDNVCSREEMQNSIECNRSR